MDCSCFSNRGNPFLVKSISRTLQYSGEELVILHFYLAEQGGTLHELRREI